MAILNKVGVSPGRLRSMVSLPPHMTPDDVLAAAQAYWRSISGVAWGNLEFEETDRIIVYIEEQIALVWALKAAGVA